jgi:ferritin-like metal-binding protein YciE
MKLNSLHDLLLDQMRDTLSAEKQLLKALPKLQKAATRQPLAKAIEGHLAETREQVSRLERCFKLLGETPQAKHCRGMEGLLEEVSEHVDAEGIDAIIDAAIVAGAQRVEHYEIAAYGCMVHYADLMGHNEVAKLLKQSLDEEKSADEKLTNVSDAGVWEDAAAAGVDMESSTR